MIADDEHNASTMREWMTPRVLRRLDQGWTRPDIADEVAGDCPIRYAQQAIRPQALRLVAEIGKANGYLVIAPGVSEAGESKQLPMISLDEVLIVCRKRITQGANSVASARQLAEAWCEANPDQGLTADDIMTRAAV